MLFVAGKISAELIPIQGEIRALPIDYLKLLYNSVNLLKCIEDRL